MAKLKNTNTKTLFELVGDPCSTSSSLGGSMFDYGEPPSLDESDNHKINERYKNSKSEADVVHGSIYEYVDVKMENDRTYLDINCKEHGLFTQRADTHIKGSGCPKCVASKGEGVKSPLLDSTKGLPKNNDPIVEGASTVWSEPSISPEDKFIDIPKEGSIVIKNEVEFDFMDQFKPLQVSELPIHIVMNGKTYKIKEIEVDDWVKSIKEVITKYQKMNMLMLYLATSTYNSKSIDVEYYIKINNLEDLLIEV